VNNEVPSLISDSPAPLIDYSVPWSIWDVAVGFALYLAFAIGLGYLALILPKDGWQLTAWILVYQPLQFVPVLVILLLRDATWSSLGFKKFAPRALALGCGLVIIGFIVNAVNNLIMYMLGVEVQAQQFGDILGQLQYPVSLLVTGALFAPLLEETLFRGFIFGGLRQRLGWVKAALVSSAIFGAMHLSLAAFIPTFTLGMIFCYLYQRSNSIWAGIIFHTLVNATSLTALLLILKYFPYLLPGAGL